MELVARLLGLRIKLNPRACFWFQIWLRAISKHGARARTYLGNSNRAGRRRDRCRCSRCRRGRRAGRGLGRCAGLGRSRSRLIGVRLWRLRRFRWRRGRLLRSPRNGNKRGAQAKGNIGRWSRVRLRTWREAIVARRAAAIDANAASGLKPRRTDMTRFEMAALPHARKSRMG